MRWYDDAEARRFEYTLSPVSTDELDRAWSDDAWKQIDATAAWFRDRNRNPVHLNAATARLFAPVLNTLSEAGVSAITARSAAHVLLRDMSARRLSYWRWDATQWIETVSGRSAGHPTMRRKPVQARQALLIIACHHAGFRDVEAVGTFHQYRLAATLFERAAVDRSIDAVIHRMVELGFSDKRAASGNGEALALAFVMQGSTRLEDLTTETLRRVMDYEAEFVRRGAAGVSRVLAADGIVQERLWHRPLGVRAKWDAQGYDPSDGIAPEWLRMADLWAEMHLGAESTVRPGYTALLKCGRWLAATHPTISSPVDWTHRTAHDFVLAVLTMRVGEWSASPGTCHSRIGAPLKPATKARFITYIQMFFTLLQQTGTLQKHFDPKVSLTVPRRLKVQIRPNPEPIPEDVWIRLVQAAEAIEAADIDPTGSTMLKARYPLAMWRAIAAVWLFGGLRRNEIVRLTTACIEWAGRGNDRVCYLHVPPNKGSPSGRKPVDPHVGTMIEAWLRARVRQPFLYDDLLGEEVQYLFCHKGRRVGIGFLADSLIPLLCRKAGVPQIDPAERIVPHRARTTMASLLYNAEDGGLSEKQLQQWLLHKTPHATRSYIAAKPAKLARAYAKARARAGALEAGQILRDRQSRGAEGAGGIDMGHGTCANHRFASCSHFTACQRCAFYTPDATTLPGLRRAVDVLQDQIARGELTATERAVIEDSISALKRLL